jgi:hypothetical protein
MCMHTVDTIRTYELSRRVVKMFVDIWLRRSFMIWYFTVSYSLEYNVLALRFVSGRLKITRAMKMFIIIKINVSLISQWSRESATAKNNQEVRYLCVINRICCPHRNQCHHNRNRQMKQGKPSLSV